MALLIRVFLCLFVLCLFLYSCIDKQNHLTQLRLRIPEMVREVRKIQEENKTLEFDIDQFESPIHLMEIMKQPEYSHLRYPYLKDVILLPYNDVKDLIEEPNANQ